MGKVVYKNERFEDREVSLNLSGFSNGIYMLRLSDGNRVTTQKVIKGE